MNFTFADVSNVFMDMVQSELPQKGMYDGYPTDPKKQAFAEKLSKTLEKIQDDSSPKQSGQSGIEELSSDKGIEALAEELSGEKGVGFVTALKKNFLMISNGSLENISIDEQGLEALKKMLLKAGFKENDLDDMIAQLAASGENGMLSMDDVFDKLMALSLGADMQEDNSLALQEDQAYIASSALPFIQSVLIAMGIPHSKVQDILDQAEAGEKGFSLDSIIDSLKSIQKTAFYGNETYQVKDGDKNLLKMLGQLGLGNDSKDTAIQSLDDFVRALEAVRKGISDQQAIAGGADQGAMQNQGVEEKPSDLLGILFKSIKSDEQKTHKTGQSLFGFSEDQIKDEFKSSLVAGLEDKTTVKTKTTMSAVMKEAAREMTAVLSQEQGTPAEKVVDQLKEGKELLKQDLAGEIKKSDSSPVSIASNSKAGETLLNLSNIKSNAPLKNLPNHVTYQVTKSIARAINQGENSLRIQLKPPELGRLMMTIDNTGNTMKVNIVTETLAAKDILTTNAGELKNVLSSAGVNLEQFEVDMDSDFRQSMADAKNQADQFSKKRQNREKGLAGTKGNEEKNDAATLAEGTNQDGSLHYVA